VSDLSMTVGQPIRSCAVNNVEEKERKWAVELHVSRNLLAEIVWDLIRKG
jgi:hypothetical protein